MESTQLDNWDIKETSDGNSYVNGQGKDCNGLNVNEWWRHEKIKCRS